MTLGKNALRTESNKQSPNDYAFAAAVLTLMMWSGTAIANKIAITFMDGLTVGVFRSMLAGIVALGVAMLSQLPRPEPGKKRLLLLISGLASFAAWPILMSLGIERTTTTHAAIIMAMIPVFTVLISSSVERQLPSRGWWVGAAAAFGATVILVLGQASTPNASSTGATVVGDLVVLAGCLVCAIGYVAGGKVSKDIGGLATTFWGLASALVVLVPVFALIASDTAWSDVTTKGWLAIGWMTVLSSLAGYGLWFYALGVGGIAKIGSLQLAMPVVTIVAAAVILGEAITLTIVVVTTIIVVGTGWAHRHST